MVKGFIHSIETFGSVDGPGVRFIIFLRGCRMRCRYCHNPDTWRLGKQGGITVSGGEALLQMDFLIDLFEKAHKRGINTCLDTAAQPFTRKEPFFSQFARLMAVTDTVLLDIKHIDDEAHRQLTGWSNANILDCARYLSEIGKPVWIRHVLVPGLTDDEGQLHRLRAFIDTLYNVQRVEVLPYHRLGVYKYAELGLPYSLDDVDPPTPDQVKVAEHILIG